MFSQRSTFHQRRILFCRDPTSLTFPILYKPIEMVPFYYFCNVNVKMQRQGTEGGKQLESLMQHVKIQLLILEIVTEINSHIIYLSKNFQEVQIKKDQEVGRFSLLSIFPTSQHIPSLSFAKFDFLVKGLIYEVKNVFLNIEGTETIYVFVVVPC